ncbi:hypothetical protein DA01_03505 [Dehalococcoides mccartyi]|uniref:Uncharacterized protein n=1 Tax=Dehalococcoides mccartyi TaxID=61435 RepID=A0A0V8M3Z6_9CHLR|nr:DUF4325 domain-containing protein [Dehalococcoides mccartyi]KSV18509.1 hypothetical protein DA01_03505 [Dehalococcoides mccartyi]
MKYNFDLSKYGIAFSTRSRGFEISTLITNLPLNIHQTDRVVVNFQNVKVISYSFADELVKNLSDKNSESFTSFNEVSTEIENVLTQIMQRRKKYFKIENSKQSDQALVLH